MKKILRFTFCVFALIACFQLAGFEEAFCEDSVMETGCEDCLTCAGHQFTGLPEPVDLPALTGSDYSFTNYFFQASENPPINLFRPPISF